MLSSVASTRSLFVAHHAAPLASPPFRARRRKPLSTANRGPSPTGTCYDIVTGVAVAETKASSPESKTNFKSFRKQFVVGLNANAKIKSPKKRGAPQAYAASVFEREETEDERRAREREEAKEKEAEALFGLGLGKAKDKKKAPARRR